MGGIDLIDIISIALSENLFNAMQRKLVTLLSSVLLDSWTGLHKSRTSLRLVKETSLIYGDTDTENDHFDSYIFLNQWAYQLATKSF
jgi:hypothetical protein